MDPSWYSTRHGGLSLHQLLEILEADDDADQPSMVYIPPPDEKSAETEEDSDNSDEEAGNPNRISRGILNQQCEVRYEESDFSEDDDNISLSIIKSNLIAENNATAGPSTSATHYGSHIANLPPRKRAKNSSKWSKKLPASNMNKICSPRLPSVEAYQAETPLDFFNLFWDEGIIHNIVTQSNIYAQQRNINLNLTKNELYVVFGAMLLSGYTRCPNKRMYWSSSDDVPKILYNSMRLNRFETILRNLHFNDNSSNNNSDKLYKLRPILCHLNDKFKEHGGLEEHISIDESMIPYYGKHYAKQYIKGKPIRFGFKNWALCTSSGYCVAFDLYTGKSGNGHEFGLGGDVVLSLLNKAEIGSNLGYKIFFDNYFTGISLLIHLSDLKICATGTIRDNRTEQCPFPDKKVWNKEKRGTYKFLGSEELSLVQWKDNKVVTMASNFSGNNIVKTTRWCRDTKSRNLIDQPEMIAVYNKGMGGVDKMDGLVAVYRTRIRKKKWYWPIFVYLFDVTVTNGWLLMKRLKPKHPNCASLLVYRRYLAQSLLQMYGTPTARGRVSTTTTSDTRFDNMGHIVVYSQTQRRCQHCTNKCNFICEKCNIGLHPKDCFKKYHSK